jgi:hypothetical protein
MNRSSPIPDVLCWESSGTCHDSPAPLPLSSLPTHPPTGIFRRSGRGRVNSTPSRLPRRSPKPDVLCWDSSGTRSVSPALLPLSSLPTHPPTGIFRRSGRGRVNSTPSRLPRRSPIPDVLCWDSSGTRSVSPAPLPLSSQPTHTPTVGRVEGGLIQRLRGCHVAARNPTHPGCRWDSSGTCLVSPAPFPLSSQPALIALGK